jgi:Mg/Co/Ni transporter MgtE
MFVLSSLSNKRSNLIFISGDAAEYLGFVYLSKVVVSQMNIIMKDIMHKSDIAVSVLMDKVQARKLLLDNHLPIIPIIDNRNRVIGAYSI